MTTKQSILGQYFTPRWATQRLVEVFAPHATSGNMVEPTCGDGGFLNAMPAEVNAVGVEIDPVFAEQARKNTGRTIITGDFAKVELPFKDGDVDFIFGNPPYKADVIDPLLHRASRLLGKDGEMALLLPAYIFQTPSRVLGYAENWRFETHMVPRTLFPGLKLPLSWVFFRKSGPQWIGMALYEETADVASMSKDARDELNTGTGDIWRNVVVGAVRKLGGRASLQEMYREIEGRRPTRNAWWKEQVRKVANKNLERVDRGVYALPERMAA